MSLNASDLLIPPEFTNVLPTLSWLDYLVFGLLLALSSSIGIFVACCSGSKMKTTSDYLVGGRSMGIIPVTMSLLASFMSAIAILAIPSDIYQNGVTWSMEVFSFIPVIPIVAYLYVPVFWDLQLTSVNEYLEIRFNKTVRSLGSLFFFLQMSLYMGIAVYAPSLALAQATGLDLYLSVSLICIVCIFYTTIGGIRAVMWTDVLQAVVMFATVLFIIAKGTMQEGGVKKVVEANLQNGRPGFINLDFDPRTRYTFWNAIFGYGVGWIGIYAVNQAQIQRYMSLGSKSAIIKTLLLNGIGLLILDSANSYTGMLLYSRYQDCDPIASGYVSKPDQMLPYYVVQNFSQIPGLAGLFTAAVFAAALSTISSGINSLAAIALEDFVKPYCFTKLTDKKAILITKLLNFYFGIQTFALSLAAEQMGDILPAMQIFYGLFTGPLLGVFTLGMFVPYANSSGAVTASFATLFLVGWITFGRYFGMNNGSIVEEILPTNICPNATISTSAISEITFNATYGSILQDVESAHDFSYLTEIYKLSYMWYSLLGLIIFMIFGVLVSFCTGGENLKKLDPTLLSPFVRWFKFLYPGYSSIGTEMESNGKDSEASTEVKKDNVQLKEKELNSSINGAHSSPSRGQRKNSSDKQTYL